MQMVMGDQSPVARWNRAMEKLREARRAAPEMHDMGLSRKQRDTAIVTYARAVDELVKEFGLMLETGVLEEVEDLLQIIYGGVA